MCVFQSLLGRLLTDSLGAGEIIDVSAIDGMADVEDKRAIQLLQAFANDPDEEIRDAVKDTVEQLQTVTTEPQPGQ